MSIWFTPTPIAIMIYTTPTTMTIPSQDGIRMNTPIYLAPIITGTSPTFTTNILTPKPHHPLKKGSFFDAIRGNWEAKSVIFDFL